MASKKQVEETIYVARSSGIVRVGDTEYRYLTGKTRVRAGHPLLEAIPEKFRPEASDTEKVVSMRAIDAPRPMVAIEAPAEETFSHPIEPNEAEGEPLLEGEHLPEIEAEA